MYSRTAIVFACLAALAVAACGCGTADPLQRQAVSGEVYLKGQPIDHGSIRFTPKDQEDGVTSGAVITDGAYSIPAEKGLPPGTYLVRISAPEGGIDSDEMPGEPDEEFKERVPPEYNTESQETVEVKAGAENKFDFRIE